jgi:hypothetical protein
VLFIATAMAWGFNRGRAFVIAATLLGAFAVRQLLGRSAGAFTC